MLSDKSRSAAISENELFATLVNGWSPLTITRKSLIKDVAAVLDPPLMAITNIYIYIYIYTASGPYSSSYPFSKDVSNMEDMWAKFHCSKLVSFPFA